MKHLFLNSFALCMLLCAMNNLGAQNPNWVMPGGFFTPGPIAYDPLPQSPAWPLDVDPDTVDFSQHFRYEGQRAQFTQAGYTGPDGELMCFVVDGNLYDKNGWLVNGLRVNIQPPTFNNWQVVKGFSEMLILPMGKSCTRFAIIYMSTSTNSYFHSVSNAPQFYMAVYNTELTNTLNPYAKGALEGQSDGLGATLEDISTYYRQNHSTDLSNDFQRRSGYHVAATRLIDNCYRYVLLSDGRKVFRYKLTEAGLIYDDYNFLAQSSGAELNASHRTEMELFSCENNTYKLALPTFASGNPDPGRAIRIFELNAAMEVNPTATQIIDLTGVGSSPAAEPVGLEFDATGRYLYFTHTQTLTWPKPLDVYDTQAQTIETPETIPSSANPYRMSFIERYGEQLYLASSTHIGTIANPIDPDSMGWAPGIIAIGTANNPYGNNAQSGFVAATFILPDQVDDDTYGNFEDFSCDCCNEFKSGIDVYSTSPTDFVTWTESFNPLNGGTGPNAYIESELRIRRGSNIFIENMNVFFGPEARVVIENGNSTTPGGQLTLNGTTFTADLRCGRKTFYCCSNTDPTDPIPTSMAGAETILSIPGPLVCECEECPCASQLWLGVVVEGHANQAQSDYGGTQQGRFAMRNGSVIEFARTAIHANGAQGKGGGELNLRNSTLKDNIRGVWLSDYSWELFPGVEVPNNSVIQRMNFVTTDDFYQLFFSAPVQHLRLSKIASLTVQGCDFSNQASFNPTFDNAGAGIYAANSGLKVTWLCDQIFQGPCQGPIKRSAFANLQYAIGVYNDSNIGRKVHIEFTHIDNVRSGINLVQTINAEVLDNEIMLNNNAVGLFSEAVGLRLIASTGYAVENNLFQFNSLQNTTTGIGIVNTSSGEAPNEIYRNTFSGLDFGIFARGVNGNYIPSSSQTALVHPGLVLKCNQFRAPIRRADIYVHSGRIDRLQGVCSINFDWAANNCFSHSGPNHFDFWLNAANLNPLNQEINYRYDTPGPACLLPLSIGGTQIPNGANVLPSQCTTQYDPRVQCQVRKSADPRVVREIRLVERMEENGASAEDVIGFIAATANTLEIQVEEQAAQFDNGLTAQIIDLIVAGATDEQISELVQEINGPLSHTLNMLISPSDLSATSASSTMDAMDAEVASGFSDAEWGWMAARAQVAEFWNDVVDFFQVDTTGALPAAELYSLLDTYKPLGYDRFAGALAYRLGLPEPSWTTASNSLNTLSAISVSFDSAEEELPFELPEMYNDAFFNTLSNVAALNEMYTSQYQAYIPSIPYIPFTASMPPTDESKSTQLHALEETDRSVLAYPNPFTSEISIMLSEQFAGYTDLQVQFFDLTGRLVQQSRHGNGDRLINIDGQQFPSGMLFYTVRIDGEQVHSGKLMHVK